MSWHIDDWNSWNEGHKDIDNIIDALASIDDLPLDVRIDLFANQHWELLNLPETLDCPDEELISPDN